MSVRNLKWLIVVLLIGLTLFVSPHDFNGSFSRLLVTFLGLISASILPAITLLLGSMTGAGRSVQKINELYAKLRFAIQSLFNLLALIAFTVLTVVLSSFVLGAQTEILPQNILTGIASVLQIVSVGAATLAVFDALVIPKLIFHSLELKREIATHEARKILDGNVPSNEQISAMFTKKPSFGQRASEAKVKSEY